MAISFLQAESITKTYGDLILFENINISIDKDQKIALIAKNGAGKTSMLNILAGLDLPDSGLISKRNNLQIGYLQQDPDFDPESTILEQVLSSDSEFSTAVRNYEIALVNENKSALEKALQRMEDLQAWDFEAKIKQILSKLGFNQFQQKIKQLSGGQKKRLALAILLIDQPELLILDEPTNHLDLEMIEWLESYLKDSNSTLFMVTHDRYFLDRVCNEIIELDGRELFTYRGNYSYFLEKRELRIENFNASVDRAKNTYRKELDWMRRMPQARTTKSKSRIESFYQLKEEASRRMHDKQINLNIKIERLGKKILELHYLSKSFEQQLLFKDFNYKFVRGEKIGIVGKNGCGKSTFLNIITGDLRADSGTIDLGETVKFGYYRQDGIQFNENTRVIDVVKEKAEIVTLGDGRKLSVSQFLSYFLFPNEMHNQPVTKLSGGEKRRLYLLTILMQNPNFLILDEPTNDLDIMTLSVLEDYLQHYSGCVLIVSHDRYFLDKVIDHVFAFEGDGIIKDYPGDYSLYREYKASRMAGEIKTARDEAPEKKKYNTSTKKFSFKDKHEYEQLIIELETLAAQKANLEEALNSGKLPVQELIQKTEELGKLLTLLDEKEIRWLELDEMINS
ncbi:MAG: ABC-F family ATP-binding cassette domain-containing protein [Bacteroidales bacterium]|nr:ABC-F family ATP-binding cassette domain-containing protein [Bacteroidales bacterium]